MNTKKIVLSAALAATTCGAALAATQQMASKTLVEKRIAETTTNLIEKVEELRKSFLAAFDEKIGDNAEDATMERGFKIASHNLSVAGELLAQAENGYTNCVYIGDYVVEATDSLYKGSYLADPGSKAVVDGWTTYYATNACSGLCSYQRVKIDGATTNIIEYITTGDGERYDRAKRTDDIKGRRTFACTTNDARTITCRYVMLNDKARRIILGLEKE